MAAAYSFNTTEGQTVDRELMILYLNTGTASAPTWSPIGKRVEDSSMEFDWQTETNNDILGQTYTTGKKPIKTQSFDPCKIDSGDAAQEKIWQLAIVDEDINSLLNQDMLIVHFYAADSTDAVFAERYSSCSVLPTSLGGEGGGSLGMPIDVTFGGTRTKGTASLQEGAVTFTPEVSV